MTETVDYVIVGAGSAGCVLADRLTESGRDSVLVLEYGGSDRSLFIQMPTALVDPDEHGALRLALLHRARAAPQWPAPAHAARQGARRLLIDQRPGVRARQPARFRALGRRRARPAGAITTCCRTSGAPNGGAAGGDEYRGADGPLGTRHGLVNNPLHAAWLEAGAPGGLPAHRPT